MKRSCDGMPFVRSRNRASHSRFVLPELGDGHEIVGPADHRAHGNDHDVDQRICHLAAARIGEFGEVMLDPGRLLLNMVWAPGLRDFPPLPLLSKQRKSRSPNHTKLPIMAQSPWIGTQRRTRNALDPLPWPPPTNNAASGPLPRSRQDTFQLLRQAGKDRTGRGGSVSARYLAQSERGRSSGTTRGGFSAKASKAVAPNAKTSHRTSSTWRPNSFSGAMYSTVPAMLPDGDRGIASRSRPMPKSIR